VQALFVSRSLVCLVLFSYQPVKNVFVKRIKFEEAFVFFFFNIPLQVFDHSGKHIFCRVQEGGWEHFLLSLYPSALSKKQ